MGSAGMARGQVERELDAIDLKLLKAVEAAGELVPKDIHQQRRLDRLELEGYLESARQGSSEPGASASWIYRLSWKGQRTLERH